MVLANIATLAASDPVANNIVVADSQKSMFEPFVSEFFVAQDDPVYCRTLKLEILTRIANADNINKLLKEFKVFQSLGGKIIISRIMSAERRRNLLLPQSRQLAGVPHRYLK